MSEYVTSRKKLLAVLTTAHGVSEIDAHRLLTEWEYEANRRGLDQRTSAFWREGEAWIAGVVAARKSSSN